MFYTHFKIHIDPIGLFFDTLKKRYLFVMGHRIYNYVKTLSRVYFQSEYTYLYHVTTKYNRYNISLQTLQTTIS